MMKPNLPNPPKWADRFLAWYCSDEFLEEIQGDLYEQFEKTIQESSLFRARLQFVLGVFRFFRWFRLRKINSDQFLFIHPVMFRNYFITTYRNLKRNWSYTLINVLGLGLAIACCIVAFLINAVNFNFDRNYKDTDRIYQVNAQRIVGEDEQVWGINPLPLAGAIANEIPEVVLSARLSGSSHRLVYDGKTFEQYIYYADSSLLDMFGYELKQGSFIDFNQPGALFIDQLLAQKLFGDEDPMGQQINVSFGKGKVSSMMIKGVFEPLSKSSTVYFSALASMEYLAKVREFDQTQWQHPYQPSTLVKLTENTRVETVNGQLDKYVGLHNEVRPNRKIEKYFLQPFASIKTANKDIYGTFTQGTLPPAMLWGTAMCGILILLMACFNFTNTSIAISGRRMKEIGIRKTLGGLKGQLIRQFLLENFTLSLLAMIAGVLFAEILTPAYNSLWPLALATDYSQNPQLIVFIVGMLIFTTLLAGSYPAWYISRFDPSSILKGDLKMRGGNAFTRVLLTLQFGIAVMALVVGIAFSQNARWQANLDLGYDRDQVVVSVVNNVEEYEEMTRKLKENPAVEMVSAGKHHIGLSGRLEKIFYAGNEYQGRNFRVGDHYLETMGLTLIDGRDFIEGSENDQKVSVIVNEMMVNTLKLENPIGARIRIDEEFYEIIGVVKNFIPYGLFNPIRPTVIRLTDKSTYAFVSARTSAENLVSVYGFMESTWKENFPNQPFEGYYQDEAVANSKTTNDNIRDVFGFMSILTLLLSATGLFAIVSLNIVRRMREIGIRKVLGASVTQIVGLINREYLIIFGIAMVIGIGLGYFSADGLLSTIFEYHNGVSISAFLLAVGALLLVSLITVGTKVYRAANSNPADVLRRE